MELTNRQAIRQNLRIRMTWNEVKPLWQTPLIHILYYDIFSAKSYFSIIQLLVHDYEKNNKKKEL